MTLRDAPVSIEVSVGSATVPVRVGPGLLAQAGAFLADADLTGPVFVVSTERVWRAHGAMLRRGLAAAGQRATLIRIPDGERHKTLRTVSTIYDRLIAGRAERAAIILAFGGGLVGDVAGYAAATFLRGVALVQVPTTVLAQVDSSIGGKVGVNHPAGKNLIGAFYHPRLVLTDPLVLRTLSARDFRAGCYEIVKYGVIADAALFGRLERELALARESAPGVLLHYITTSVRIKAAIVEQDERETDLRRILNFGHTVGHALEAATKYRRFRHGEAIGWGMLAAATIARQRGTLVAEDYRRLADLIASMGQRPRVDDLPWRAVFAAMQHDKKKQGGRVHFVLPRAIGQVEVVDDISEKELRSALKALGIR